MIAYSIGELSTWGTQFLSRISDLGLLEFEHNPDFAVFLKKPSSHHGEILFVENGPKGRSYIEQVRSLQRKSVIVWFGRSFSKEELSFALESRVYGIFENIEATDPKTADLIKKLTQYRSTTQELEHLLHELKRIMLQSESEPSNEILKEMKTVISKLERRQVLREFDGGSGTKQFAENLPSHATQDLTESLLTIQDLDRTGVLWVQSIQDHRDGKIEFVHGKPIAARTGEIDGEKAIYRMLLWDNLRLLFDRKEPEEISFRPQGDLNLKQICQHGEDYRKRFATIRSKIPPLHVKLALDPSALQPGRGLSADDFLTLASVVEFGRVAEIIDYTPLPDVVLFEAMIRLRRGNWIQVQS